MTRPFSNLPLAVFHALVLVAATILAGGGPRAQWPPVAAPLLLVCGLLAADLVSERRFGRRRPSAGALLLSAAILVASAILGSSGADRFAAFVPILGCAAVAPALWRDPRAPAACR